MIETLQFIGFIILVIYLVASLFVGMYQIFIYLLFVILGAL